MDDNIVFFKKKHSPVELEEGKYTPSGKEVVLREKLEQQGVLNIQLDASRPNVEVPSQLKNEKGLALNVSWKFEPPFNNMKVTSWGIRATLSFEGQAFSVALPWSAIYRIGSVLWLDEIPEEMKIKK